MTQILVRQLNDAAVARLKARAKERNISLEALAREVLHAAAEIGVAEKLALVRRSQEWSRTARVPGTSQTLGVDLIREDRDHDH